MDKNKVQVLRSVPYVIPPSCNFCKHGTFTSGSDWGMCQKLFYKHTKHDDEAMNLSISRFGACPLFEEESYRIYGGLADFSQFFDWPTTFVEDPKSNDAKLKDEPPYGGWGRGRTRYEPSRKAKKEQEPDYKVKTPKVEDPFEGMP